MAMAGFASLVLVGRHRGASSRRTSDRSSAAPPTGRPCSCYSAMTGSAGSWGRVPLAWVRAREAAGPVVTADSAGTRESCGCSTRNSATRCSWLVPLALVGLGRGPGPSRSATPDGPSPRGLPALGRLVPGDRGCLQPHDRRDPQLLRRRARAGDRRARRRRHHRPLAAAVPVARSGARPCGRHPCRGRVVGGAAEPDRGAALGP